MKSSLLFHDRSIDIPVHSDVSQEVEDSLASTEPGSEIPAPILDVETEVIVDEVKVVEVNEIVDVENERYVTRSLELHLALKDDHDCTALLFKTPSLNKRAIPPNPSKLHL